MSGTRRDRYTIGVAALAMAALLCPLSAHTQQMTSSIQDPGSQVNTLASSARMLAQGTKATSTNPFERPASSEDRTDSDSPDSLLLQSDGKFTSYSAEYAFTAPPDFFWFDHDHSDLVEWNSSLTSAFTAYLNPSSTTAMRMTGDLESYGQRRQAGMAGDPGARVFTMQWEASHVVDSPVGSLEIAAGRYRQHLVSYPAFTNGPLTDVLLGYSATSAGFQTTATLPDRNIALSFRYGSEHLGSIANKAHTTLFEFSWTW